MRSNCNWVRLDCGFPRNHKVLALVGEGRYRAAFAYVCSLAYVGEQGTDGFLPRPALIYVHATEEEAQALVEVALWLPRPGGFEIRDWTEYQPTSAENEARSARAKAAARIRWSQNGDGS